MAVDTSNAAGRLHALLSRLRKRPDASSVLVAWSNVLGVAAESREFYLAFADVLPLVAQARVDLEQSAFPDPSMFEPGLKAAEQALAVSLRDRMTAMKPLLPNEAMVSLEMCSTVAKPSRPEASLDEAALETLRDEVEGLLGTLRDWDSTNELRSVLIDSCYEMLQAIDQYLVGGHAGIKRALARLIGSAAVVDDAIAADDDDGKGVMVKVKHLAMSVALALQLFHGVATLPEAAHQAALGVSQILDAGQRALEAGDA